MLFMRNHVYFPRALGLCSSMVNNSERLIYLILQTTHRHAIGPAKRVTNG